jgi:hypothetical protein
LAGLEKISSGFSINARHRYHLLIFGTDYQHYKNIIIILIHNKEV